uniref:POZ-, AT hook-, and zinc finger-containing protein 1-like isoform X2 n=1 Tax=Myxine glutinosa TaxID=7769 RepID=UPI00358E0EBD
MEDGRRRYTYRVGRHSAELLEKLNVQRHHGHLCDVIVKVGGERFPAHRAVLAACSRYFEATFSPGATPLVGAELEMHTIGATVFRDILDFAYTSQLTVRLEVFPELMTAAKFLLMNSVTDICQEMIRQANIQIRVPKARDSFCLALGLIPDNEFRKDEAKVTPDPNESNYKPPDPSLPVNSHKYMLTLPVPLLPASVAPPVPSSQTTGSDKVPLNIVVKTEKDIQNLCSHDSDADLSKKQKNNSDTFGKVDAPKGFSYQVQMNASFPLNLHLQPTFAAGNTVKASMVKVEPGAETLEVKDGPCVMSKSKTQVPQVAASTPSLLPVQPVKRGRGRPRKNPLPQPVLASPPAEPQKVQERPIPASLLDLIPSKSNFECGYCGKEFRDGYHLRRHEMRHARFIKPTQPPRSTLIGLPTMVSPSGVAFPPFDFVTSTGTDWSSGSKPKTIMGGGLLSPQPLPVQWRMDTPEGALLQGGGASAERTAKGCDSIQVNGEPSLDPVLQSDKIIALPKPKPDENSTLPDNFQGLDLSASTWQVSRLVPSSRTLRRREKQRTHSCEDCGKFFRDIYHLKRHRLSHSDEKPFECPVCRQRFKRKDRMSYHIRTHIGSAGKAYTCDWCNKGFSRPDHLTSHVRQVHLQDRPFTCQVGFPQAALGMRDTVNGNAGVAGGKYSCRECNATFLFKSHMKRHMRMEHIAPGKKADPSLKVLELPDAPQPDQPPSSPSPQPSVAPQSPPAPRSPSSSRFPRTSKPAMSLLESFGFQVVQSAFLVTPETSTASGTSAEPPITPTSQ